MTSASLNLGLLPFLGRFPSSFRNFFKGCLTITEIWSNLKRKICESLFFIFVKIEINIIKENNSINNLFFYFILICKIGNY